MIVGHGDIASVLDWAGERKDINFFASGVSNSREERDCEYKRERRLLDQQPKDIHLVYFSSLCIYYANTAYAKHKIKMEERVKLMFKSYTIVRVGNIDWGVNPNTIINYFRAHPDAEVKSGTYRFVVSKNEFIFWIKLIRVGSKEEMNITGHMLTANEIYNRVQNGYYGKSNS